MTEYGTCVRSIIYLHRTREDTTPAFGSTDSVDHVHHVNQTYNTAVRLAHGQGKKSVIVHHLQCLQYRHIRRHRLRIWRHDRFDFSNIQWKFFCYGASHHIFEPKNTDKLAILDDKCSLTAFCHEHTYISNRSSRRNDRGRFAGQ